LQRIACELSFLPVLAIVTECPKGIKCPQQWNGNPERLLADRINGDYDYDNKTNHDANDNVDGSTGD
ncbi:hypothetical protein, partial [Mesorhizobium sp.]|uniref:hypothetical protein n=1 Tax=Mesorhizobium sp. TaxID=1871066 RepID=UPI0025798E4C